MVVGIWAAALKELAEQKFTTDELHRAALAELLVSLRREALADKVDGRRVGALNFVDFLEEIAKLRDSAAAGSDLLQGGV